MLSSHTMRQTSPWQMGQAAVPHSQQTKGLLTQRENKVQEHPFSYPIRSFLSLNWLKATHAWRLKSPRNEAAASQPSLSIPRARAHHRGKCYNFVTGNGLLRPVCEWVCHHESKMLPVGRRRKECLCLRKKKKISAGRCSGRCVPSAGCLLDDV